MSLAELRARLESRRSELRALRIAVLAGGGSSEREVSLRSGRAVASALAGAGYEAELLRLGADNLSIEAAALAAVLAAPVDGAQSQGLLPAQSVAGSCFVLGEIRQCGIVLTTLHGSHGENGAWQGLLELASVPYVSAGVKGSALAMDKVISKRLFEQLGIPTPRWWVYKRGQGRVPAPCPQLVAKPVAEGSSVGVLMFANDEAGWRKVESLSEQYGSLLVEERVSGQEITAGLIGASDDPVALPLVEIKTGQEFYDYEAKYGGQSSYECPARLQESVTLAIQEDAGRIYSAFELGPYARIDCIVSENGERWFLEANTLPGFTELSLLPMAARAAGIEMVELLELLMLCALERHEAKRGGRA